MLEIVLNTETQMWETHRTATCMENEKSGMSVEDQIEAENEMFQERESLGGREESLHAIILRIAPSPAALDLAKRVKKWNREMIEKYNLNGLYPKNANVRPTKAEWKRAKKEIDGFIEEIKRLPQLTPEQAKSELDAITDDQVDPFLL